MGFDHNIAVVVPRKSQYQGNEYQGSSLSRRYIMGETTQPLRSSAAHEEWPEIFERQWDLYLQVRHKLDSQVEQQALPEPSAVSRAAAS